MIRGEPDACWVWPGRPSAVGYGVMGHHFQQYYAHRLSYEVHVGPIPAGLFVCHRCDNRICVNPAHLFLGTNADNMADKIAKGRHRHGETRGRAHPLAKLDEAKVRMIRSSSLSDERLAEQLGVASSLVYRVRKRQSWAHVV